MARYKEGTPLVSIVIPTFMRLEKLEACIKSIQENSYPYVEIIVVNDDPNNDLSKILMKYPVQLIQNNVCRFPAYCRNIGANHSHGELLFFVDDDNVLKTDTIESLVDAYLSLNNAGLLGPRMFDRNGNIWFLGAKCKWDSVFPKPVEHNTIQEEFIETDVIPNAYMISKHLYIEIGMEDDTLKIFNEELDLAVRLKKSGFDNFVYTGSNIIHDYGTLKQHLSAERIYYNFRNSMVVWRRYANRSKLLMFTFSYFIYAFFYFAYKIPVELKTNGVLANYRYFLTGLASGLFSSSRFRK